MTELDVRTLLICIAALNILLGFTMALYWRTQRVYPGFGLWTVGNALLALSYVLYSHRGDIPATASVILANGMAALGGVYQLEALRRFFGRKHFDYRVLILPALLTAALAYFTYARDDPYVRTFLVALLASGVLWAMGLIIAGRAQGRDRASYLGLSALPWVAAAFVLVRGVFWLVRGTGSPLLDSHPVNVSFYLGTAILDVAFAVMFIALNHARTSRELESACAESEEGRLRLEEILGFLPDATFVVDAGHRIIAWNRAAEQFSGVRAADALGRPDREVFAEIGAEADPLLVDLVLDPGAAVPERHRDAGGTNDTMSANIDIVGRDGRRASLWLTAIALRDSGGNVTGAIECIRDMTERARAGELLEESERKYRALFDLNLDGVLMTSTDGVILDANPAACALLGMTSDEIRLKGRSGIIAHGPSGARAAEEQGQTGRFYGELTLIRNDGTEFLTECHTVLLPGWSDPPQAFVIFRDISERARVEEQLRDSESRLVRAQEVGHVGSWELDLRTKTMWASSEAYRIYGLDPAACEFGRLPLADTRVSPLKEEHDRLEAELQQLVDGGRKYDLEFRICRPSDGAVRLIHSMADLVRDETGAPVKIVGIIEDITDRREAEKTQRLTQYSVDHAADSVFWTDSFGRLIYVSDSTCARLGYSRDQLLTMTLKDIDPSLTMARWKENSETVKKEGTVRFETVHRGRSGEVFPVEVNLNLVAFEGGEYNCVFARDISERRLAEAALRESEERLAQSLKMEAVGQLAGGIAHDFNNLLTAIIGYSDLILVDEALRGLPARDDVEQIKAAAERAGALTRQILAFSRRQALRPRIASLNDILTGMEPLLRRTLGEDIELVTRQHPHLGLVEVDTHQFEQVLMNLAVNARDAMPLGGRLLFETCNVELDDDSCRAYPDLRSGSYIMLSVADTGVGMDSVTASHIFEPFFTTKGPGQGTGLGLSTVYGIVRQSGGSIDVVTEAGGGTTFRVFLPRAQESPTASTTATAPLPPAPGGETVLVVEDDAALRSLVSRVLTGLGYTTLLAEDADKALVILDDDECKVDLLLTDIVLPGALRGDVLAERATIMRPGLPVLHMSGYTRDAIVHAGRLDEGINFISKPFTTEALATVVRDVLDRARRRRA